MTSPFGIPVMDKNHALLVSKWKERLQKQNSLEFSECLTVNLEFCPLDVLWTERGVKILDKGRGQEWEAGENLEGNTCQC